MAEIKEDKLEPSHVVDESQLEGEPGHPGPEPYKDPNAPQPKHLSSLTLGTPADAARSFANTMTLGAAPELEGAMGALASSATYPLEHHDRPQSNEELLNAYKAVRDEGKKQHDAADSTALGKVGSAIGVLTPHPLLPMPSPGASIPKRIGLGAAVGAGVGGISGAANSPGSLTSDTPGDAKRMLLDTGAGMVGGGVTGGLMAGGAAAAQNPVRQLAEAQALKAAGLRGGISSKLAKKGYDDTEALALGRGALDEGLIPFGGSKAAVRDRATALQNAAGTTYGAQLAAGGNKLDFGELTNAMLEPYNAADAVKRGAGAEALRLVDQFEQQGRMTPGSFIGAGRAKSSAWDSANFSDAAKNAPRLYRETMGAGAKNIEDQLRRVSPAAADALKKSGKQYGIASDIKDLSKEAAQRELENNGVGITELLAGIGGAAAGAPTGHAATSGALGVGTAALAHVLKHRGNAAAARTADFLANRLAENSGGHAGGLAGQSLVNRLAPWEEFLKKDEEKP